MLNLTSLLSLTTQPADNLRYGRGHGAPPSATDRRPVVVWNITRRCNLHCIHCYSDSDLRFYPGELTDDESHRLIDDLADFKIPALLLSGGEPLMRPRFFDIARYAAQRGLRLTLSTNGTLITPHVAEQIRSIGFSYVGISLDGIGPAHDNFRGKSGSFNRAVAAFRACQQVGQKVGLRLTLSRQTFSQLDQILDFIESENIPRVCFYHLVYSGRGSDLASLSHQQSRQALDKIINRVEKWIHQGSPREVLTVDQPADAAYLLLYLQKNNPSLALRARQMLEWNGGAANSSGIGIANIDSQGNVHPDQFWHSLNLGNVRHTPFSQIWRESKDPILLGLRSKPRPVQGRCSSCLWLPICGGGFRVRAWQRTGNPWAEDPA
ncbi:MAG: radical SAM protein, partial [Chthoniobacterales bacterium]|nr:radical SAM protein [Chthoniobacterales bacterium]